MVKKVTVVAKKKPVKKETKKKVKAKAKKKKKKNDNAMGGTVV